MGRRWCSKRSSFGAGDDRAAARPGEPARRLSPSAGASLRFIRETMLSQLEWSRHLQVHASAVAASGRVVLFAGPRGAGKTSLVGHVAAAAGAGLVSNDRVIVTKTPSGWDARGVPTIVSIRRGRSSAFLASSGRRWSPNRYSQSCSRSTSWGRCRSCRSTRRRLTDVVARAVRGSAACTSCEGRLARVHRARRARHRRRHLRGAPVASARGRPAPGRGPLRGDHRATRRNGVRARCRRPRCAGGSRVDEHDVRAARRRRRCVDVGVGPGVLSSDATARTLLEALLDVG